jgi:hypothetical protein
MAVQLSRSNASVAPWNPRIPVEIQTTSRRESMGRHQRTTPKGSNDTKENFYKARKQLSRWAESKDLRLNLNTKITILVFLPIAIKTLASDIDLSSFVGA